MYTGNGLKIHKIETKSILLSGGIHWEAQNVFKIIRCFEH